MKRTVNAVVIATFLVALSGLWTFVGTGSHDSILVPALQATSNQGPSGHPHACGLRSVRGRYGFSLTGTQFFPPPTPPVQAASVGVVEFDGHGGFTGSDIVSLAGQVIPRTLSGTYAVQPNCTLEVNVEVLTGTPGWTFHFGAVLVDGGRELLFIQTDPGALFVGTLKR